MNERIDKAKLMAYLYGELEGEEKEQVAQYLQEHPEKREDLNQLAGVSQLLNKLEDQDPVGPLVIPSKSVWRTLVPWMSAAAAVMLIFMTAYLTDFTMILSKGQMTLSFGPPTASFAEDTSQEKLMTQVKDLLEEQQVGYQRILANMKADLRLELVENQELSNTNSSSTVLNPTQLQALLDQHQFDQMQQINQLLEDNSAQQREEIQVFLAEYHQYLEERRLQDLQLIEAGFQAMQDNVNQQQSETEEILANIITTAKSKNY